jgi:hypothetical protein
VVQGRFGQLRREGRESGARRGITYDRRRASAISVAAQRLEESLPSRRSSSVIRAWRVAIRHACSALTARGSAMTAAWTAMAAAGSMPETAAEAIGSPMTSGRPACRWAVQHSYTAVVPPSTSPWPQRAQGRRGAGGHLAGRQLLLHRHRSLRAAAGPEVVSGPPTATWSNARSNRSWLASNASDSPRPCGWTGSGSGAGRTVSMLTGQRLAEGWTSTGRRCVRDRWRWRWER